MNTQVSVQRQEKRVIKSYGPGLNPLNFGRVTYHSGHTTFNDKIEIMEVQLS